MAIRNRELGALNAAERNLHRAIELSTEVDDKWWLGNLHRELGRVLATKGTWQESEENFKKAVGYAKAISHTQDHGTAFAYRALRFLFLARSNPQSSTLAPHASAGVANLKSAIECAQRALELADKFSQTGFRVERDYVRAHWLLGAAYCVNNDLNLAEENLSKALHLCRQINMVDHEADILLDLARLRYASHKNGGTSQDDLKDAQEKASEALVITERSGYVLQGADVHLFLAELALEEGKLGIGTLGSGKEAAIHHAKEALKLATCDGPPYYYKVAYEEAERFLARLQK